MNENLHLVKKVPITILMAEDDEEDRMLVEDAWEECKILNELHIVQNGVELLAYLKNEGDFKDKEKYPRPGFILLDLNMPKMDGRQALKEIKSNPKLCKIPVIVLTTSKAEEDILRSYNLGANSYIAKPVTFKALLETVSTLTNYWLNIVELSPE